MLLTIYNKNKCIMRKLVLVILGLLALVVCGCRGSKVVTVEVPKIEKEYVVSVDTVHQFDSVWVYNDRRIERDTVYISKVNEKFRYIYKTRTDTLLRTDTVTIVNTEQIKALVKENDKLKAVGYFYRRLGLCLIGIIAVMGLYIFFKR